MKKIRLFFYGVIFLTVMSGLFSARTVSGHGARTTSSPVAVTSQGTQTPEDLPPPSIRFERITIAEGLSFSKVDHILQDRQGFLWVGTERGLNKYDGYQFTVYRNDPADPRSLSHDRIYALYEDSAGELWVGTALGLDRLDRATGAFVHYQAGVGGNPFTGMPGTGASVLAIQEDRNGVLWVGSTVGLYHLDPDSQAPTRSQAWQEVDVIAENIDGKLWVADLNGLYLHDPQTDQSIPVRLGVQAISAIHVDPGGDVWVGAPDGLWLLDQSTGSVVHYQHDPVDPNSLIDNRVTALLADSAGRLWVGTNSGLDLFDRGQNRFVHYRYNPYDPYSLGDNFVHSLYEDRSGVLWIGTGRGLSKYSWAANRFTLYTRLPDIPAVSPEATAPDSGLDLATHTAGFPRWPSNYTSGDSSNPFADYTLDQMYEFLSGYRLTRAPGSTYEYSCYGFGLMGNLLVRQAGQADYGALLLDRITRPLGMESTRIELTPDMRTRLAAPRSSYSVVTSNWHAPTLAGSGAILSTANDLLTFLAANMGITDTELRPALQLAITPQRPGEMWTLAYIGLGWNLPGSGNGIHYHGGGHFGYSSFLAWDSERKIGVVVLMNVSDGPTNRIAFPLLRGFPLTPVPVDPSALAAYAGSYQFDDLDVMIRVDGTRIYFGVSGSGEAELITISEDRFYLADLYADIAFYQNDRGEVDRMEAVVIGGTLEAMKIP